MRITPLDIRKQEFRRTMRGLDTDEVYAFLTTVAEEYEAVLSDNKKLREHMVELEERLKDYKNIEKNLRNTLLTAERVTSEAKENARREASLIVREAEIEAEKAAETIRAHTVQLRREILQLKKQKDNYLARVKTLLESHGKVIDGFEEDFEGMDREIEEIGKLVEEDAKKAISSSRRMSRENITEEFKHGPQDKVTWGDERKREEEPRPSMPRPDWSGAEGTERDASAGGGDMDPTSAGAAPAGPGQESASNAEEVPHLDVEPIGAVEDIRTQKRNQTGFSETPQAEMPLGDARAGGGGWAERDSEEGREVAKNIEERVYPGIGMEGGPGGCAPVSQGTSGEHSPGGDGNADRQPEQFTQQPGAQMPPQKGMNGPSTAGQAVDAGGGGNVGTIVDAGTGGGAIPGMGDPVHQGDNWKGYEVREAKTDWSNYSIAHGGRGAEIGEGTPSESEVDEALSNLTNGSSERQSMEQGAVRVQGDAPETGAPGVQQEHNPPAAPQSSEGDTVDDRSPGSSQPVDGRQGESVQEQEERSGSTWSMDELRKNLMNFGRDRKE